MRPRSDGRGQRVLMTADTVGGVWTYAIELVRALAGYDIEVTLATMGPPPSNEQCAAAKAIANLDLQESSFRLEWMTDCWSDVACAGDWLQGIARHRRYDIVHLNGYVHAALEWPAPVVVAAHSCVLSWWQAVRGEPAPASWHRYRDAVARGLGRADALVTPSHAMLAALAEYYPLPRRRGVIANGLPLDELRPAAKQPYFFAAGRLWDEGKNLALLDAIADALPWPVYVAGEQDRPEGNGGKGYASLRSLGHLSRHDLVAWLEAASVYVLPARYEPFGLSVLEAAACGCALVLGDIPSLRESWAGAAIFVPPNDPAALRRALLALVDDPHRRDELAARALRRSGDFTVAASAYSYAQLYAELAGRPPARAAMIVSA